MSRTPERRANAQYCADAGDAPGRRAAAGTGDQARVPVAHRRVGPWWVFVALAILLSPLVLVTGCGASSAVNSYTTMANQLLYNVNTKEGELKKYWVEPLAQQAGMSQTLTEFRKAIADAQAKLDATDSPDPARKLDDLLGKIVDQSRAMADINTQFADYLGALGPLAKQASDIVGQIQGLDKVQDVPSTIDGMVSKAQVLDGSLRSITAPAPFQPTQQQVQAFVGLMLLNLTNAQKKLENQAYQAPYNPDHNADSQASDQQLGDQEHSQAVQAISDYTDPIVEEWGRLDGQVAAVLGQVRESTGLQAKASEVENYIGQAVAEIKALEQQYK